MPSATLLAADLSTVALAKFHSRVHPRLRVDAPANELEECRSVPGTARHATWVAVPKRRLLSAIPAVRVPSFECRGHPVSSLESMPVRRFSLHEPERLGGRPCFHEDLGRGEGRLREENARPGGPGCLEPCVGSGFDGGSPLVSSVRTLVRAARKRCDCRETSATFILRSPTPRGSAKPVVESGSKRAPWESAGCGLRPWRP
jgi:hypothetical protein